MSGLIKSAIASLCFIVPSLALGLYLGDHHMPSQYGYFIACAIILMAVLDFAIVAIIEQYRRQLGRLTLASLLSAIGIILAFLVLEAVNRFVEGLGYDYLTPAIALGLLLLYAGISLEKSLLLKSCMGINGIAMVLLWTMGVSDKITMPF